jgi:thioredoxin 1
MTTELTTDNFNNEVVEAEGYILVDFWAEWCGPCRMMGPILEEIHDEGIVHIGKLDVDKAPEIAASYQVRSIPTLILFKDGEPVTVLIGHMPKRKLLDSLKTWMEE